jgi:hypothetical protein
MDETQRPKSDFREKVAAWPAWISAIAQVLTVALLTFGYFYTVVPTYQRDRLAQEVDRLTAARELQQREADQAKNSAADARRRLDETRTLQEQLSLQVGDLVAEKATLEDRLVALRHTNEELTDSVRASRSLAAKAMEVSEKAQVRVFQDSIGLATLRFRLNASRNVPVFSRDRASAKDFEDQWQDLSLEYPAQLAGVLERSSSLPVESTLRTRLSREMMDRLKSLGDIAKCHVPPFESWARSAASAYLLQDEQHKRERKACGDERYQHWIKINDWSDKDLESLSREDWWKEMAAEQSSCGQWHVWDKASFLIEREWNNAVLACSLHLHDVNSFVVGWTTEPPEKSTKTLEPPDFEILMKDGTR